MNRQYDRPSRLARKEGSRLMKQAGIYVGLTVVLLFLIIRFGIPAIINMAVFLGDLKASSQPIGQDDTIAPAPPILDQLPIATTSAKISIHGYGESQSSIKLYRSGTELLETFVAENGDFSFADVELESGSNDFYTISSDSAGNQSGQSNRVSVIYDTLPPKLAINTPANGAEFFGELKRNIEISGTTDPGTEVKVNDYYAVVSSEGSFTNRLRLEEGENTIVIVATDEAGNETSETIKVRYSP